MCYASMTTYRAGGYRVGDESRQNRTEWYI
jgi:hypothetical protein